MVLTTQGEKSVVKKVRTWRKEISWKGRVVIIHAGAAVFIYFCLFLLLSVKKATPCERGLLIAVNESAA
jgi:hypothetical protein